MQQLVFVYNADAGLFGAVLDLAHKLVSPTTYPCSLCAITYGVRMRPEWKAFIAGLPIDSEFLHRDELAALYPWLSDTPLPAVFMKDRHGELTPFIAAAELKSIDLTGLMQLVEQRLSILIQAPSPAPRR
ncbi:hypothetical protein [Hymenobacter metallicola]|uniref:GTPase n=1 Tax=Hymenobacter metallicola TaxID=2563114 RepID=A0A4Z0QFB0_9BACT|nr:hypothetical protein [Hymenobacter metallicola]TGE28434.1 hypothetical protein E5K02_02920 [Hymenobacter metallicola]